jgi:hypothetical protein
MLATVPDAKIAVQEQPQIDERLLCSQFDHEKGDEKSRRDNGKTHDERGAEPVILVALPRCARICSI